MMSPVKSAGLDKPPPFARPGIIGCSKQDQLLFAYEPLAAYFGTVWAALPQKTPQRFLMYADLPGSITNIYETF
jgi:hypothetical protein